MNIALVSSAGELRYSDTPDHFENGLLRLLNLRREEFDHWLELAGESDEPAVLERLRVGWAQLRPPPAAPAVGPVDPGPAVGLVGSGLAAGPVGPGPAVGPVGPGPAVGPVGPGPRGLAGRIRHAAIAETPSHGVAVSDDAHHGWLVRWDGARFVRETRPPSYEDEYFEGDKLRAGGYGNYMAQADWRLEKAARQIREMRARTALARGRVLDVGSGYGFFRVALGAAGYEHDGLEVSQFARAMASSAYGLRTHEGTLAEHCAGWESRYDAVTLFDLIEHVDDPGRLLEQVAHVLRPGGVLGIKTPNIDCPEAQVFGPHYHSLKREHLSYFSAASLTAAARGAGFEAIDVASVSHLLVGFVGRAQTRAWERELHGADLVAWYRLGAAGGPPLDHSRVAV